MTNITTFVLKFFSYTTPAVLPLILFCLVWNCFPDGANSISRVGLFITGFISQWIVGPRLYKALKHA